MSRVIIWILLKALFVQGKNCFVQKSHKAFRLITFAFWTLIMLSTHIVFKLFWGFSFRKHCWSGRVWPWLLIVAALKSPTREPCIVMFFYPEHFTNGPNMLILFKATVLFCCNGRSRGVSLTNHRSLGHHRSDWLTQQHLRLQFLWRRWPCHH